MLDRRGPQGVPGDGRELEFLIGLVAGQGQPRHLRIKSQKRAFSLMTNVRYRLRLPAPIFRPFIILDRYLPGIVAQKVVQFVPWDSSRGLSGPRGVVFRRKMSRKLPEKLPKPSVRL
jgi:hypothetical protein